MNIREYIFNKIEKERENQVQKRHTVEQDSIYKANELLLMAVWRIINSTGKTCQPIKADIDYPFLGNISPDKWFKPCEDTYKLIQAAALIVAELERQYTAFEYQYMDDFFKEKTTEDKK